MAVRTGAWLTKSSAGRGRHRHVLGVARAAAVSHHPQVISCREAIGHSPAELRDLIGIQFEKSFLHLDGFAAFTHHAVTRVNLWKNLRVFFK